MTDAAAAAAMEPGTAEGSTDTGQTEGDNQAAATTEGEGDKGGNTDLPEWAKPGFKHKIKSDGVDEELDYDDLVRLAQKGKSADSRFKEASTTKKETEQLLANIKNNPIAALKQLEATPYFQENPKAIIDLLGPERAQKFAEDLIWHQMQQEKMSPEQRELEELREQKKAWDAAKQKREEDEKTQAFEAERNEWREKYTAQFGEALDQFGLPKTPETIEIMASLNYAALENGYEPDLKELAEATRTQLTDRTRSLLGGLDEAALFDLLGEDISKKLRMHDISRLKSPTSPQPPVLQDGSGEGEATNKTLTMDDILKGK